MDAPPSAPGSELGRRVAVAAVGIPVVLLLLYFGGWIMGVPLAGLAAVAAWEVYDLAEGAGHRPLRWLGVAGAAALVLAAVARPGFTVLAPWAFGGISLLAGASLLIAMRTHGVEERPLAGVAVTVLGVLYAAVPLAFVVLLHALPGRAGWHGAQSGSWSGGLLVVLPLAATWVGDSAAYFIGSAFGKARVAPSLSPNKSWAGAFAGLVASALAAGAWFLLAKPWLPGLPLGGVLAAAALGGLMAVGGQAGDFAESMLKREAGVKDSGTLFPGHGGVLDRMDALVFAFPIAYGFLILASVLA